MSSKTNNNNNQQALTSLESSSSNFEINEYQQLPIKFIQYVSTCKNCLMISICDKKRLMCPFCGSFYELDIEKELKSIKSYKKGVCFFFLKQNYCLI
jgi:hypothetical protein